MLLEHPLKEQEEMHMTTTRIEAEESEKERLYTAEGILDHGDDKGRLLFEVRWYQYGETSWAPIMNLCTHVINQYLHRKRLALPENVKYASPP